MRIPFNRPFMTGKEIGYIREAHDFGHLAGDGPFSRRCQKWLEEHIGCRKALLTNSCTAALEMAAILADIRPGDEIIMPSYTFVSTANAFALRGGVPVFVDIRGDVMNLDETRIEAAVTARTRAIVPVHYAGVSCEMEAIMTVAERYGLLVIEDAAHACLATYRGRPLGSIGHLAAVSFHETKNIISGEGGALLVNDPRFAERAEIVREKGTDRGRFLRGEVDKYTWVDIGSSFLPSELIAAFLWAQMEDSRSISERRMAIWNRYHRALAAVDALQGWRRPLLTAASGHNAHMYYLLAPGLEGRTRFIRKLGEKGIHAVFHYVPLHSSPAGRKLGRAPFPLKVTEETSRRLVRLPLWIGVEEHLDYVIRQVLEEVHSIGA